LGNTACLAHARFNRVWASTAVRCMLGQSKG
jgi:hypothetical protein